MIDLRWDRVLAHRLARHHLDRRLAATPAEMAAEPLTPMERRAAEREAERLLAFADATALGDSTEREG